VTAAAAENIIIVQQPERIRVIISEEFTHAHAEERGAETSVGGWGSTRNNIAMMVKKKPERQRNSIDFGFCVYSYNIYIYAKYYYIMRVTMYMYNTRVKMRRKYNALG